MELDHIAVAGETLDEASQYIEETLGVSMLAGGKHDYFGTHNRLLGLADGLYLEAIAIDPDATNPDFNRWFDLDHFSGPARLQNWICRTDDLATTPSGAGREVALSRGDLRWNMLVPDSGILPFDNLFPAILRWKSTPIPGQTLPQSGCRLRRVLIGHPRADELDETLQVEDPRLQFEVSDEPKLLAFIDTPNGERVLS